SSLTSGSSHPCDVVFVPVWFAALSACPTPITEVTWGCSHRCQQPVGSDGGRPLCRLVQGLVVETAEDASPRWFLCAGVTLKKCCVRSVEGGMCGTDPEKSEVRLVPPGRVGG